MKNRELGFGALMGLIATVVFLWAAWQSIYEGHFNAPQLIDGWTGANKIIAIVGVTILYPVAGGLCTIMGHSLYKAAVWSYGLDNDFGDWSDDLKLGYASIWFLSFPITLALGAIAITTGLVYKILLK
ncbi:MAG: hypothetical protein FD167_3558 [bacterium]|nr:MAG: hypothetical protein FD167_3558 [bacterium]